jgi:hypothetical protein
MHPTIKAARLAGALYLLLAVTGVFGLMYVPGKLIVRGDGAATANNILAHETLFRLGIVDGVISSVIFIFLVMALYRLLSGVDKKHASLMVVLVLASVAVGLVDEVNHIVTLVLVRGADFLAVFDKPQREALAMLFLGLDGQGLVNQVLWGLWLFPFGVLVFRSRFLPRILGVWLIVNGFAYLAMSFTGLLLPHYEKVVSTVAFPALFGELAIALWLLIMGARPKSLAESGSASASV